jgi:hypothetical protein
VALVQVQAAQVALVQVQAAQVALVQVQAAQVALVQVQVQAAQANGPCRSRLSSPASRS